jgi:hypothetical protein
MAQIQNKFSQGFSQKRTLVFIGSDWNHQSYQAAFGDKDTFYILLLPCSFKLQVPDVPDDSVLRNVKTLKLIAKATYLTISDKSILSSLKCS